MSLTIPTLALVDGGGVPVKEAVYQDAVGNIIRQFAPHSSLPSYRAVQAAIAAVSTATDVLQIVGSASKRGFVTRVAITGVPGIGTAASQIVALARRNAKTSAGGSVTVTAITAAKYAAANATPAIEVDVIGGAAATIGTGSLVSVVKQDHLYFAAATVASVPLVLFEAGRGVQPLIVDGVADVLAITWGTGTDLGTGHTPGATFNVDVEWFEL